MIVVGRFAGSQSLAAVGSTTALINLMINIFIGLSVGVNVIVARYYGAKREKDVQDTIHTAMALSIDVYKRQPYERKGSVYCLLPVYEREGNV